MDKTYINFLLKYYNGTYELLDLGLKGKKYYDILYDIVSEIADKYKLFKPEYIEFSNNKKFIKDKKQYISKIIFKLENFEHEPNQLSFIDLDCSKQVRI